MIALLEEANKLIEKSKMDLSIKEEPFVRQSLATLAVPSLKLLTKYHKTINDKGGFPTILVLPETNFNTTFYKLGYLGRKRMSEKAKLNYSRVTIVQ